MESSNIISSMSPATACAYERATNRAVVAFKLPSASCQTPQISTVNIQSPSVFVPKCKTPACDSLVRFVLPAQPTLSVRVGSIGRSDEGGSGVIKPSLCRRQKIKMQKMRNAKLQMLYTKNTCDGIPCNGRENSVMKQRQPRRTHSCIWCCIASRGDKLGGW